MLIIAIINKINEKQSNLRKIKYAKDTIKVKSVINNRKRNSQTLSLTFKSPIDICVFMYQKRQSVILSFNFLFKSLQTHFKCCVNVNRDFFQVFFFSHYPFSFRIIGISSFSFTMCARVLYLLSKAIKAEIISRSFSTIFRVRAWSSHFYFVPHLFCAAHA